MKKIKNKVINNSQRIINEARKKFETILRETIFKKDKNTNEREQSKYRASLFGEIFERHYVPEHYLAIYIHSNSAEYEEFITEIDLISEGINFFNNEINNYIKSDLYVTEIYSNLEKDVMYCNYLASSLVIFTNGLDEAIAKIKTNQLIVPYKEGALDYTTDKLIELKNKLENPIKLLIKELFSLNESIIAHDIKTIYLNSDFIKDIKERNKNIESIYNIKYEESLLPMIEKIGNKVVEGTMIPVNETEIQTANLANLMMDKKYIKPNVSSLSSTNIKNGYARCSGYAPMIKVF